MLKTYEYPVEVVNVAKLGMKQKLWRGTDEERTEKLQALLNDLWTVLSLEGTPFTVVVWPNQEALCRVDVLSRKLFMRKPSLVSSLWGVAEILDVELPTVWANGLFYKIAPKMFRNSVSEQKISIVSLEQLDQMETGVLPDKLPPEVLAQARAERVEARNRPEAASSEETED